MRSMLSSALVAGLLLPGLIGAPSVARAADCEFKLGFKALHDLIPSIAGECIENEHANPQNGDALQMTTKGLMAWRKADNWTAFTDGSTTWINGPQGLQSRPNSQRFSWEPAGTSTASSSSTPPASAPASAPASQTPPPQPPAAKPPPERSLDQLALFGDEGGDKAKASGTSKGSDSRASWYQITYKRDRTNARYGPEITVNRVYRAKDDDTARQIYNEQAQPIMPEAKELNLGVNSLGPQRLDVGIGDESAAFGACLERDCQSRQEVPTRHYRLVFRMGNLVETMYTFGPESGNNVNTLIALARTVEKRILTPPEGPPPEIFTNRQPAEISLGLGDLGLQIVQTLDRSGSDGRASWYEARFERDKETYTQRMGPVIIYNKIFVANSPENAAAIYRENTIRDLPEATEKRGPVFDEPKTKPFGNESFAIGACNDDCSSSTSESLHERLVFRWGNVVAIVYIWGREDQSNPGAVGDYANTIVSRAR
jgi:hypothetical protein